MLQYTPLELTKLNTKQNSELVKNKPEFQRLRVLLSNVVRKNENYGYSDVYGYFEQKKEVVEKVKESATNEELKKMEAKQLRNKHRNFMRRQRAKRVKKTQGKSNDGKRNSGKRNDGKQNDGKQNDGKQKDAKRNTGKQNVGKQNDGKQNKDKLEKINGGGFEKGIMTKTVGSAQQYEATKLAMNVEVKMCVKSIDDCCFGSKINGGLKYKNSRLFKRGIS